MEFNAFKVVSSALASSLLHIIICTIEEFLSPPHVGFSFINNASRDHRLHPFLPGPQEYFIPERRGALSQKPTTMNAFLAPGSSLHSANSPKATMSW